MKHDALKKDEDETDNKYPGSNNDEEIPKSLIQVFNNMNANDEREEDRVEERSEDIIIGVRDNWVPPQPPEGWQQITK